MEILVLLAGVADSRFPLHNVSLDRQGDLIETGQTRRILGPFDEGALELALKLRDKNDATRVNVVVLGGPNEEALARTVVAFKPDNLRVLKLEPYRPWDAALTASQLAQYIRSGSSLPDLLMVGREFGDLDEGSIPLMLAGELSMPLFALAQYAQWQGDQVRMMRERGTTREWLPLQSQPVLATVTNDKRNKLRHPLMKNVMMAKRQSIEKLSQGVKDSSGMTAIALSEPDTAGRSVKCQILDGSVREQAVAIANYIRQAAG